MVFLAAGINHKTGSILLREKLNCSGKKLDRVHRAIAEAEIFNGAFVLSTCNRMEVYAVADEKERGFEVLIDFISSCFNISSNHLMDVMYFYDNQDAMNHLCRVYAGLDSLIIGEKQIVQQVDESFALAKSAGLTNSFINDIFFCAGKIKNRVHSETDIARGKVSVGSVAVDFIKKKNGPLTGKRIIIVGLGKVTELVLKYLMKENLSVTLVANKNYERALMLASKINADVIRFDETRSFVNGADIIVTATSSPHTVLKFDDVMGTDKELLIVDLAFPRDVDPAVGKLKNIELIYMEDLKEVIRINRERKSSAAEKAREIIIRQVGKKWEKIIESAQEQALLL